MNMRRLDGDTETRITPEQLTNNVVPLWDEEEAPPPVQRDRSVDMVGILLVVLYTILIFIAGRAS